MATRTFCDICGEECPAIRTQVMALTSSVIDLGELCTTCRTEVMSAVIAWRDERTKTKKSFQVVDAVKEPEA